MWAALPSLFAQLRARREPKERAGDEDTGSTQKGYVELPVGDEPLPDSDMCTPGREAALCTRALDSECPLSPVKTRDLVQDALVPRTMSNGSLLHKPARKLSWCAEIATVHGASGLDEHSWRDERRLSNVSAISAISLAPALECPDSPAKPDDDGEDEQFKQDKLVSEVAARKTVRKLSWCADVQSSHAETGLEETTRRDRRTLSNVSTVSTSSVALALRRECPGSPVKELDHDEDDLTNTLSNVSITLAGRKPVRKLSFCSDAESTHSATAWQSDARRTLTNVSAVSATTGIRRTLSNVSAVSTTSAALARARECPGSPVKTHGHDQDAVTRTLSNVSTVSLTVRRLSFCESDAP